MKTLEELPNVIKESLACHEYICRLGYSPDNIYTQFSDGLVRLCLKTEDKMFWFELPMMYIKNGMPGSREEFEKEWEEAVDLWNKEFSPEQQEEIWKTSRIYLRQIDLIKELLRLNIKIPAVKDERKFH